MSKKKVRAIATKAVTNTKAVTPRIESGPIKVDPKVLDIIRNGLFDALLGPVGSGFGTPLNQINTLRKNNRNYLISNDRQLLSELYVEHGLIQTICNVPVEDGLAEEVEISTKQLDPFQIELLRAEMEERDDMGTMGSGLIWTRLFGGGGVILLTDQDPMSPLDMNALANTDKLGFDAVDMWELYYDKQTTEGYNPVASDIRTEFYDFYGQKLHYTRVMKLKGLTAPSWIRPRLRGWGFSVVEALVNSINQYLKSNNVIFEIIDEFKLDIFKFDGLAQTFLSGDGMAMFQKRLQIANGMKNYNNAISLDKNDDYNQKQLSFAGLPEMMKEFRIQIAADMRMPMTKLFGLSASGFNSGEDDIEVYNSMVKSQVRKKAKFHILKMIRLRCLQLFGMIPSDLKVSFKPMRELSATEEEGVKTSKFNRVQAAADSGRISPLEYRDAVNKDNLLPVQLDTSDESLFDVDDDDEGDEQDDEGEGKKAEGEK